MLIIRTSLILLALIYPIAGYADSSSVANSNKNMRHANNRISNAKDHPFFVQVIPSERSESYNSAKEEREKDKLWYDKSLAIATAILAFFTFCLFLTTYCLARDSRKTSERQAKEMQNSICIAKEAADAAAAIADASNRTAETMEKTAETQLRAYLGVHSGGIDPIRSVNAGMRYKVYVEIANFGSTPAKKVTRAVNVTLASSTYDGPFDLEPEPGNWVIAPNGPHWTFVKEMDIAAADIEAINNKQKAIFFWGIATYEDVSGRSQKLGFRYRSGNQIFKLLGRNHVEPDGWILDPEKDGNYTT